MLQSSAEKLRKFLSNFRFFNIQEIRQLSSQGQFRDVVENFEAGRIKNASHVYDTIGYCYYQLANYTKAVHFLALAPQNYYSRFFLALSLNAINKRSEAIQHLLNCLRNYKNNADEILDHLLPIVLEISDEESQKNYFEEISVELKKSSGSLIHKMKVAFYQKKNHEIETDSMSPVEVRYFYRAQNLSEGHLRKYQSLSPQENLCFVNMIDKSEIRVELPMPYVAEVPSALVVSGSSLVFLEKDLAISDLLADEKYGKYVDMSYDKVILCRRNDAVLIKKYNPDLHLSEGVMLCGLASAAYGHWFAEFIPKLRFFESHPQFAQLPIIIDEGMPQTHYDFLRAMVNNPFYILPKGKSLKVEKLLIAPTDVFFPTELKRNHSVPVEHQASLTIGALKYIGAKARKYFGEPVPNNSRIFLSRRKSTWRRLINEQELIDELKKMNFEVVYCEDLSFAEQVSVFQKASCIVAPNGSALNNLIFCDPKVKILLLGQNNLFNWGGWFGSFIELGYSPQYLAGESVGRTEEKHSDYKIEISIFKNKIREILGDD